MKSPSPEGMCDTLPQVLSTGKQQEECRKIEPFLSLNLDCLWLSLSKRLVHKPHEMEGEGMNQALRSWRFALNFKKQKVFSFFHFNSDFALRSFHDICSYSWHEVFTIEFQFLIWLWDAFSSLNTWQRYFYVSLMTRQKERGRDDTMDHLYLNHGAFSSLSLFCWWYSLRMPHSLEWSLSPCSWIAWMRNWWSNDETEEWKRLPLLFIRKVVVPIAVVSMVLLKDGFPVKLFKRQNFCFCETKTKLIRLSTEAKVTFCTFLVLQAWATISRKSYH